MGRLVWALASAGGLSENLVAALYTRTPNMEAIPAETQAQLAAGYLFLPAVAKYVPQLLLVQSLQARKVPPVNLEKAKVGCFCCFFVKVSPPPPPPPPLPSLHCPFSLLKEVECALWLMELTPLQSSVMANTQLLECTRGEGQRPGKGRYMSCMHHVGDSSRDLVI